ncbi:AraC family transcriptional regulator [Nocardia sp. NPDC127579]|uniref:helix-turn-helix transcriptional regulator n=1 Tax=Nocardia sp. NPDC127579 TaxID=3345402 RepID=UPI003631DA8B
MRWYGLIADEPSTFTELADSFVSMDHRYDDPRRWRAQVTVQESATYRMLRWQQESIRLCDRGPSHLRRDPADDFYWIVVPERGVYSMRYGDQVLHVPPGRASLTGYDETCRLRIPDSAAHAFQVPRTEIDARVRSSGLRTVLDTGRGLGRIAAGLIAGTHAEQDELTGRDFDAVCERIVELVCLMAAGDTEPPHAQHAAVSAGVRRYLREHIGHRDVRLPAVAHALGWSPRQVRAVLQREGTTFRDVRREEALRVARALLADPRQSLSIGELAARCGFTASWFSAAFKARYGQTPREFRRRAADTSPR